MPRSAGVLFFAGSTRTETDHSGLWSAAAVLGLEEKRIGCKRYPLRVRILYFFASSPTSLTLMERQPLLTFGLG